MLTLTEGTPHSGSSPSTQAPPDSTTLPHSTLISSGSSNAQESTSPSTPGSQGSYDLPTIPEDDLKPSDLDPTHSSEVGLDSTSPEVEMTDTSQIKPDIETAEVNETEQEPEVMTRLPIEDGDLETSVTHETPIDEEDKESTDVEMTSENQTGEEEGSFGLKPIPLPSPNKTDEEHPNKLQPQDIDQQLQTPEQDHNEIIPSESQPMGESPFSTSESTTSATLHEIEKPLSMVNTSENEVDSHDVSGPVQSVSTTIIPVVNTSQSISEDDTSQTHESDIIDQEEPGEDHLGLKPDVSLGPSQESFPEGADTEVPDQLPIEPDQSTSTKPPSGYGSDQTTGVISPGQEDQRKWSFT